MKAQMQLTGLDKYLETLKKAGENIDLVSRDIVQRAGNVLLAEMQKRVPVGDEISDPHPGRLLNSIKIFTPSGPGHYNYVEVGVLHNRGFTDKDTAIQANAIEFGANHHGTITPARSFIRSAIQAKRSIILNLFRARLQAAGLVD